jgi:hypothetical protein
MDSKGPQSFNSFGDLSIHFKERGRRKDLQRVLELFGGGHLMPELCTREKVLVDKSSVSPA